MTKPGLVPERVESVTVRSSVAPVASQRFALHVTMSQSTRDKLQHAQELLSHQISSGDIAEVLYRALDALITKLEKKKFAATDRPLRKRRRARAARTIPSHVRREVWKRDGGRCSFVSEAGVRCSSRERLEFDHVRPVSRGGGHLREGDGRRLCCVDVAASARAQSDTTTRCVTVWPLERMR